MTAAGVDCVVVGGGIVGSSVAYHLARRGRSVWLVDRADEGAATPAGAGIVSPATSLRTPPALVPAAVAGAVFYRALAEQLAEDGVPDAGYATPGSVLVASDPAELDQLPDAYRGILARRDRGDPSVGEVALLDPAELRRLIPVLAQGSAGVLVSGGARVDGRRVRDALREAFVRRGGRMLTGSGVLALDGERATVLVAGTAVAADTVVLATGAWQPEWTGIPAIRLPVVAQRGQILHARLPGTATGGWPSVVGFTPYYLLGFAPDRVVFGATRESGTGFDARVTVAGQAELTREGLRLAPGLGEATVLETRVGFRPATVDDRGPVVGPLPGTANVIVATGLGALGLTMGPWVGAAAAAAATGDALPAELAAFGADRF